ncbi:MAG: hypothetical protein WA108_04330 [Thiobacillus sp.]
MAVKVVLVSCQHPDYDPLKYQQKDKTMSVLPVYQVEFIPLERRLDDRRVAQCSVAAWNHGRPPQGRQPAHGRSQIRETACHMHII